MNWMNWTDWTNWMNWMGWMAFYKENSPVEDLQSYFLIFE